MREHLRQHGTGYLVAFVATAVVLLLRLVLATVLDDDAPLSMFVIAVVAAAWFGGWVPGMVATLCSTVVGTYVFIDPAGSLVPMAAADYVRLVFFVGGSLVISGLFESLSIAQRRLAAQAELERLGKEDALAWKARYEAAVKASGNILYDSNLQTGQVVYGGDCEGILGYTPEQLNGDVAKWISLIHAEDRDIFLAESRRANDRRTPYRAEYRMIDKDGQIVWMRDDGHFAVEQPDGHASSIVGFVKDITRQRQATQEKTALAQRLTSLMDHTPLAVIEWNADFVITRWSGQSEKLFGWTAEEAVGQGFEALGLVLEEDQPQVDAIIDRMKNQANRFVISENRNYTKAGEVITCQWYNSVLHDEAGQLVAVLSLVLDVTERERAEHALRESEERFRLLADAMPQVVWVADADGTVRYYNSRVEGFSGVTIDADGTWKWQPVLHPDDVASTVNAWENALETQTIYQCEHRVHMADGSYRWHLSRGLPVVAGSNQQLRWFGTATDIHDLKLSQDALRQSESHFRTMADNAPTMLWVTDPAGNCTYLSQRWYDFTGGSPADDLGTGWYGKIHPEERQRAYELILAHNKEHTAFRIDYRLRQLDGQYRWVIDAGLPRFDAEGCFLGFVGTVTENHDRKMAEEELRKLAAELSEANHRKTEFLATLGHELRNPLAPIRTGLELLKMVADDPAQWEATRQMMERQTKQLIRLIDDLLDVSRITRGKLELRKRSVALADVVQSAVEAVQPFIDDAGHQLTVTQPEQPIYLDADPNRLAQVFSNLLNNAAKCTPDKGHLWLTIQMQASDVVVTVKDDGIGIPSDMQSFIFEMFTQINHPTRSGASGLGIGLMLVKSIVEMHNGKVDVYSEGIDKGSEFRVRLPVPSHILMQKSQPAAPQSVAAAPMRVLVVDDNRAAAETLSTVIQMLGHEVRTAADGLQAVDVASEFLPDMVLMDIGMPRMNGYEAARTIRQQPWGEKMTLVALTGWGQQEDKQRSKAAGFDNHLVKPAEPSEVQRLLAAVHQPTS